MRGTSRPRSSWIRTAPRTREFRPPASGSTPGRVLNFLAVLRGGMSSSLLGTPRASSLFLNPEDVGKGRILRRVRDVFQGRPVGGPSDVYQIPTHTEQRRCGLMEPTTSGATLRTSDQEDHALPAQGRESGGELSHNSQ